MVEPQVNADVKQVPGPVSPRFRGRVQEVSSTYRCHDVKYEPGPHSFTHEAFCRASLEKLTVWPGQRAGYAHSPALSGEPERGIEPLTYALRVRCSAG